jgi:hypothetical protein
VIVWLDHRIFGNGWGLKSPYFDAPYYFLSGRFYTWIGGYGAQLQSIQWTHPKPGEERTLLERKFKPFQSNRRWCRVMVSWATPLPDNIDAANIELREMKTELTSL